MAQSVEQRLPPLWRDPWALCVALAVLPALFAARGGWLGEPVADDFGFLYHALLRGPIDWLSGGGSPLYWRPLSRQLYYLLLGRLMLGHPMVVAGLQALALAAAGVLLYRALRPSWPARAAAAAGVFPLLLEAVRQLIAWPSCAQDLLALLFGVAALHALSRGRRTLALSSLALALLCKETAIAFALALPLWPAHRDAAGAPARWRDRGVTAIAAGGLLAVWWLAHGWVSRHAGLLPPPRAAAAATLDLWQEAMWAVRGVWRDAFSVRDPAALTASWLPWAIPVCLAPALAIAASTRDGRARLRSAGPWLAWAAVWTAVASWPLATFFPVWSSYRSVIPAVGLGIALVAVVQALPVATLLLLPAIQLAGLLTSPRAPARIAPSGSNIEFDFPRISMLQHLAHEVRATLVAAHPQLPRGARIARNQWPRMTLFAFQDPRAFQVWYGDSSLRVIEMAEVRAHPLASLDAIVEFEPHRTPQVAMISPVALQHVLLAAESLTVNRDEAALALLADFERLQADTSCAIFMATGLSVRGAALLELRREDEAVATLAHALEYFPQEANAHRVLSEYHQLHGRIVPAIRELQEHLRWYPNDVEARQMLERLLREQRSVAPRAPFRGAPGRTP